MNKLNEITHIRNINELWNHPHIIHEIIHTHIHERFGFKEWRIFKEKKGLICETTIPKSILYPKNYPKLFLWSFVHLIHELFSFMFIDIILVITYLKEFLSINIKIIRNIKIKE
ncbi:hypothetical protein LCGC14_2111210 [marine sediment metagenome]|uniref:Uncharacterized protein n=1 Tax=marine sediment metagenome TaxID=412755 RepID=A0A0F9GK92_9ZZZZ